MRRSRLLLIYQSTLWDLQQWIQFRCQHKREALANYGKEVIAALANFYGYPSLRKLQLVDPDKLIGHYEGFKEFVFKKKLEWETKHESDLETVKACLNAKEKKKATLSSTTGSEKLQPLIKTLNL